MEQKIILLDDDIEDLEPLEAYLKENGVRNIFCTTDVDQAIKEATEKKQGKRLPAMTFVCDYHLGYTNGYEVMVKVLSKNKIVHFVFMSNAPTLKIYERIADLGSGFYYKDKNERDFKEKILTTIRRSQDGLESKLGEIIRREREDRELLDAAAQTLKILR